MASKRRRGRPAGRHAGPGKQAIDPPLIALVVALALVAIIAYYTSSRYTVLSAAISHPYIIHPPIRMFIGVPLNISAQGLKYALVNQTFCPENSTIMKKQARTFVFPYYTSMNPGTVFDYTMIYNASRSRFEGAAVLPPFKLLSYRTSVMQDGVCAGYPDALGNVTLVIQAPDYNITGQLEAVLYMLNKTSSNGV